MPRNILLLSLILLLSPQAQVREWVRLFGGKGDDAGTGVAFDKHGAVFVAGQIDPKTDDFNSRKDICLLKFDVRGDLLWSRIWGNRKFMSSDGIAATPDGGVIQVGAFSGTLDGNQAEGSNDVFAGKFDANGKKQWMRVFGSPGWDRARGVAVDRHGSIYVIGNGCGIFDSQPIAGLCDVFLVKYSREGKKEWTRRLASPSDSDEGRAVAVDGNGNVVVAGFLATAESSGDMFVAKYDPAGNRLWLSRQTTGTSSSGAFGLAVDERGGVYATGMTQMGSEGLKAAGADSVFLMKFDPAGNPIWKSLFGNDSSNFGLAVAVDREGGIRVTGCSNGRFAGLKKGGDMDAFLASFDPDGKRRGLWVSGQRGYDAGAALAFGPDGYLYLTGTAGTGMEGQKIAGGNDVFLMKFATGQERSEGLKSPR